MLISLVVVVMVGKILCAVVSAGWIHVSAYASEGRQLELIFASVILIVGPSTTQSPSIESRFSAVVVSGANSCPRNMTKSWS